MPDEHDTQPLPRFTDDDTPTERSPRLDPSVEFGSTGHTIAVRMEGNPFGPCEDAHYIDRDRDLIIGCDGMGGHKAGQEAAKFTSETLGTFLASKKPANFAEFASILTDRNGPIREIGDHLAMEGAKQEKKGMNTTLAAMQVFEDPNTHQLTAGIAWSGDSRVYVLRRQNDRIEVEAVTRDDNLATLLFTHYPHIADFVNNALDLAVSDTQLTEDGQFEQQFQGLMAVLPPESVNHITEVLNTFLRHSKLPEITTPTLRGFFDTRNVVTQSMNDASVHVRAYDVQDEDLGFIVTTDGVHDPIDTGSMSRLCTIVLGGGGNAQTLADTLVEQAYRVSGLRTKNTDDRLAAVWLRKKTPPTTAS